MSTSPATVIAFVPGTTASELNFASLSLLAKPAWPSILNPTLPDAEKIAIGAVIESNADAEIGNIIMNYPVAPTGKAGETPCYQDLVDFVTCQTPFQGALGTPFTYYAYAGSADDLPDAPERLFYAVPYDWRIDNATSATNRLQPALDLLSSIYPDGNYTLYLVAHSNGGLVSRYLLEDVQTARTAAWWPKLKSLITLATPHLGSPLAWLATTKQFPVAPGFIADVVDSKKFPSTYELLPPENAAFIGKPNSSGGYDPENIYAAARARSGELHDSLKKCDVSFGNMSTAAAFANDLQTPTPPTDCSYHFFYGKDLQTLAVQDDVPAFTYVPTGDKPADIFVAEEKANWPSAGDSVVPEKSGSAGFDTATPPANIGTQSFSGYNHGDMGGSDMVNHPDSIVAMLKLCGVTDVSTMSKAAE